LKRSSWYRGKNGGKKRDQPRGEGRGKTRHGEPHDLPGGKREGTVKFKLRTGGGTGTPLVQAQQNKERSLFWDRESSPGSKMRGS